MTNTENEVFSPELLQRIFASGRFYSKSELARKLDVSPTWVNDLIYQGKVAVVHYNGGCFVYEVEQPETAAI